jgi:hypothetical protein
VWYFTSSKCVEDVIQIIFWDDDAHENNLQMMIHMNLETLIVVLIIVYETFEQVYSSVPMMELSTLKLSRTLIKDTTKIFVCFRSWMKPN